MESTIESKETQEATISTLVPEKERISLDYTAKGFATWNITLKEDRITDEVIKRLQELDTKMRETFQKNVMSL